MTPRNMLALVLIIASLVCLYPGLTADMLTIKVGAKVPLLGRIELQETTQSIMGTIRTLYEQDNRLVASLILLFSVLVPILKAMLLLLVLFFKKLPYRKQVYKFVGVIGKWSMADVFIVGVLLAFLASRTDEHIEATLQVGFYYFLAYCLISLLGIQLLALGIGGEDSKSEILESTE
ncbi:MAG: paraquat-inducible protein A [Saprospiraceae bacterium]